MILQVIYEAQTYFFDCSSDTTYQTLCTQICERIPWITIEELQPMFSEYFPTNTTCLNETTLEDNAILRIITFR